jgi:hypothetical protein
MARPRTLTISGSTAQDETTVDSRRNTARIPLNVPRPPEHTYGTLPGRPRYQQHAGAGPCCECLRKLGAVSRAVLTTGRVPASG